VWEWNGKVSRDDNIPQQAWFSTTAPNDYGGHGKEIFHYVVHADSIRRGRPHMLGLEGTWAWLNKNPGNLTAGGRSVGEYPGKRNWHGFLVFPTEDVGFAAIPRFLEFNGYFPLSIRDAIKKYAPRGDGRNKPEHYAQHIVDALAGTTTTDGQPVTMETTLATLTDTQMIEVQKAIRTMEGTVAGVELSRDDPRLPDAVRALL